MSPDHVYIVLEPVGSARLTFGDDRYYQFMCFDVSEVVRSPGCDHGHDEESRNGRDIKIDILDDYIRTSEEFRNVSDKNGVPEGLPEPPRGLMGHMGSKWRSGGAAKGRPRAPSPSSPNWTRRGAAPLFPSFSLSFPSDESYSN